MTDKHPTALAMRDVQKSFGGAYALKGVDLTIQRGELHALLGHNGSGKSTLLKVIAGYHVPDSGTMSVYDKAVSLPVQPGDYRKYGLGFVHQDLGLVPHLSVLENLYVYRLAAGNQSAIHWTAERRTAERILAAHNVDIDPATILGDLSRTQRAQIAIVRAVEVAREGAVAAGNPGAIVILDEVMAYLASDEALELTRLLRHLVAQGDSVVLVTHDLDDVYELADRVTVLRDGRVIGVEQVEGLERSDLVSMIVGSASRLGAVALHSESEATRPELDEPPMSAMHVASPAVLEVKGLRDPLLNDVDIVIRAGEVVGITGIMGSGFENVPYLLVGAMNGEATSLTVLGRELQLSKLTPRKAIEAGMALLPGDRALAGIASLTLGQNMAQSVIEKYRRRSRRLDFRSMEADTLTWLQKCSVSPPLPGADLGTLSGGNQQKVLLGKWLRADPKVLLLHEPAQGVDVGAREDLQAQVRGFAARGDAGVLCATADTSQLVELCDRVMIFFQGVVQQELVGSAITREHLNRCVVESSKVGS